MEDVCTGQLEVCGQLQIECAAGQHVSSPGQHPCMPRFAEETQLAGLLMAYHCCNKELKCIILAAHLSGARVKNFARLQLLQQVKFCAITTDLELCKSICHMSIAIA